MRNKTLLLIALLSLVPALVLVILQPWGQYLLPSASAAHLDTSFTSGYNISNSGSYNSTQHPRLKRAADGYLHVTWMEGVADTSNGPAYVRGIDTTWPQWEWAGPSNNPGYTNPAIALGSDGTVHLVWAGGGGPPYDIFYASKPTGGAWSAHVNISNSAYNTVYPSIGLDSTGRIWVAYQSSLADTNNEIFVINKPVGGNWSTPLKLSTSGKDDLNVSLVVDKNDVVHVVWRNNDTAPNWEIIYTRYQSGTWTTPVNISATSTASHFPRIATDGSGRLYVIWEDEIDGSDAFESVLRRSTDGGLTWSALARASNSPKALYPAISADDGCNVYAVWQDYRASGQTETYFSRSTDCGVTWLGDENVSLNGSQSYFPDVFGANGGTAHVVWQDMAPGQLDIYYSKGTIPTTPTPTPTTQTSPTSTSTPTNTPTSTPTNTPTPTPTYTPTPDPRPHGSIDIHAYDPIGSMLYTRLYSVTLALWATSDVGATVTDMWVCNLGDTACTSAPVWIPYAEGFANWPLIKTPYPCEYKTVQTAFRDDQGRVSQTYGKVIQYDSFLTASMSLNNGAPYANHTMVVVNSVNLDAQEPDCTGLEDARFRETQFITYTAWMSYSDDIYLFLADAGPVTRTVEAQYRDYANNLGSFTDDISLDMNPPYSGTPPTLNSTTTKLLITVSGLLAYDDESGVAHVWLANRPDGPWMSFDYCSTPPCAYEWNLAYGGPPFQYPQMHHVYVKYEDAAGGGIYPGNFSPVYDSEISVSGISNIFLPLVLRGYSGAQGGPPPVTPAGGLLLLTNRLAAGAGDEILLYLAAPGLKNVGPEGTLQLILPEGLRAVRAWSAYGTLVEVGDHTVVSRERAWTHLTPWILVRVRVEPGAESLLQVQGTMTWDGHTTTAAPVQIQNR